MNKQITEDYVSYENAVLLKEKGFDEVCFALYNPEEELIQCGVKLSNTQVGRVPGSYSAPTHQMALKWLRENNLYIEIRRNLNTFYFRWKVEQGAADKAVSEYKYDTYEQAVEAAILYVLKNLI